MSSTESNSTRPPVVSDEQLVLIVYLLYFAAYIFGITALIGVIIAHLRFPDATVLLRSHYQFQIRTFWIGLLFVECQFVAQLSSRPAAKKRAATTLDISFPMSFQQVRPARAPPLKSSC